MARTTFAYFTLIFGIAGLILPVIPGIILVIFALNLLRESESGRRLISRLRNFHLIDRIATRITTILGLSQNRDTN